MQIKSKNKENKIVFLDNAAGSFPKAPGVAKAILAYINDVGVNVGRASYAPASAAALTMLELRESLCRLFNFGHSEACIITPGATFALNLVLKGYLKPGDHVIVSPLEHNAMMRPLNQLATHGISFDRLPADENGLVEASAILPLIKPNTKMIAMLHASNVCGSVLPISQIGQICAAKNIPFLVDASQSAGHIDIDMQAMHISALAVPGHKGLLGPSGIGALLMQPDFAASVEPLVTGGTGSQSDSEVQPLHLPDRFEAGTQNLPGIYGFKAALDFIEKESITALQKQQNDLAVRFIEGILNIPAVRLVGPTKVDKRVGVISLDFQKHDNAEAAYLIERSYGIFTRCGLHCAPNAHKTLGTYPQGTVRFSLGWHNTKEDIDAALEAIATVSK